MTSNEDNQKPVTNESQVMRRIIDLCIQINRQAAIIYGKFVSTGDEHKTNAFWDRMSKDTSLRLKYWEKLKRFAEDTSIPFIFEEPTSIQKELEENLSNIDEIMEIDFAEIETNNKFLLAFRLEFFMLHRAFATFCNFTKNIFSDEKSPADNYEEHLDYFIESLKSHGGLSSELELVAQTIRCLWEEIRILTIRNTFDYITGIHNKSGFFQVVTPMANLAKRNRNNIGFIILDIDDFKRVNDLHGHQEGDRVLETVAQTVKSSIRKHDIVGRYGGDEIVVFLPTVDKGITKTIAERIRSNIEGNSTEGVPVTASIGFFEGTITENVDKCLQDSIKKADEFLYVAKNEGKNRIAGNQ